jgi:Tfp pilus assembly protein PilX
MKTKKGFILYLTLILLSLLLLMSLGLSQIFVFQSKILETVGKSVIAYYAAETGVENALYEYYVNNKDPSFSISTTSIDSAQYSVDVVSPTSTNQRCSSQYYSDVCIISTGKFLDTQRVVSSNY